MFTRTLAVGLGEVRQPQTSAQCLRAASTAGALLAGYFPHLRAAFRFPQHLAGLPTERGVGEVRPQIASLISAQELPSADVASEPRCPVKDEEPPSAIVNVKTVDPEMEEIRTSVVATLMAREYGPKMTRLESKCMDLYDRNHRLQVDSETATARSEKTRELNRRLCREVNEARSERTGALEELDRLKQEMAVALREVKQARCENSDLRESFQSSQEQIRELTRLLSDASKKPPLEPLQEEGPDPSLLAVPMNGKDGMCSCSGHSTWGCTVHRVYSDSLLLAHRSMATKISDGPPGLEMELPPGLDGNAAEARGNRLFLQSAC